MKVIKRGKIKPPEECGRWKCWECNTVFEIEPDDPLPAGVRWEDDQRDGETLFGFPCPVCGDAGMGKSRPRERKPSAGDLTAANFGRIRGE